ncbi:MAG TPA: adenosylcobinamide-GDP ribazoletransferase [Pyrinomonadaceae bacterium]|nr:adenosylcobinamide-GDP ribazoletransferase [Pyrinomonadaceae bacterium]
MIRRFFIALQFLTRLPVPRALNSSETDIGKAAAFFPLIGVIVGGGAALVFVVLQRVLPLPASVFCAIVFAVFITNGFHEDGLADSFDGFGGGWTKDRVLEIMRDSRIGTYGTLALIFVILGKFNFLSLLPQGQIWRWLIVAHTASRWTTLPLCAWLPYARAEGQGKLVAKQVGAVEVVTATITLLLVLILVPWQAALAALLVTTLVTLLSGLHFRARLQGITGDCLGATNQLTEIALYLTAVILVRFSFLR